MAAEATMGAARLVYLTDVPPESPGGLFDGEPDTFDMNHAAKLLGVTRRTIQREIDRGNLRCFHVGTRVRITKQALIDYVLESEGA